LKQITSEQFQALYKAGKIKYWTITSKKKKSKRKKHYISDEEYEKFFMPPT
jgi:hypothetical protein